MRYGSLGLEFFVTFIALLFAGTWLDRRLGTQPILTLCGAGLGFAAGLYRLIRRALQLQEPPEPKDSQDD